jgi:hypothetical protein
MCAFVLFNILLKMCWACTLVRCVELIAAIVACNFVLKCDFANVLAKDEA